ncbi:MAG: hypothetical protein LC792_15010 [Actinobacteria bacterium]|nr:hypothetical protein [Actinomycetota bacterium]
MWAWPILAVASDQLAGWAQYGVLGLLVVALVTGLVVPGPSYKEALRARDAAEERERRLRDTIEGQMLPLVHDMISLLEKVPK